MHFFSVNSHCLVKNLFLLCRSITSGDGHVYSHVRTSPHMIRAQTWHISHCQLLRQCGVCGIVTLPWDLFILSKTFRAFFSVLLKAHLQPVCPISRLRCIASCHLAQSVTQQRPRAGDVQVLSVRTPALAAPELFSAAGRAKPGPSVCPQPRLDV